MFAIALVYLGLITVLLGSASLVKPLSFLGIRSRLQAIFVLGIGLLITGVGWAFPANEVRAAVVRTQLDLYAPVYQFNEFHSVRVMAPRDRVYRAIKDVTPAEIRLFRTLTWLRRFGRPGPESILNAPEHLPILEVATRTSFLLLAEEPDREIVVGTLVLAPQDTRFRSHLTPEQFRDLDAPGFAKGAMNFLFEGDGKDA